MLLSLGVDYLARVCDLMCKQVETNMIYHEFYHFLHLALHHINILSDCKDKFNSKIAIYEYHVWI